MAPNNAAQMQAQQVQQNMINRAAVINNALPMLQNIYQRSFTTGNILGAQINVPVRNVGLIRRFYVQIDMTFARSASETFTLQPFGPANVLSQCIFNDLSNNTRINTAGWHLHLLATAKGGFAYGAAFANDSPVDIGSNFNVISAPGPTFAGGTQTLRMFYEIPLSYSDDDLRGAMYAAVVSATATLQLTINPNFSVASTADGTLAVYKSSTTDLAVPSAMTVTVYQDYLDQVPMTAQGPILPVLDLSTVYLLNNTNATGLVVNQETAIPYANFRNFLSTFVIYDNAGVLNTGSDIAYMALQSANYTNIWNITPAMSALMTRKMIRDDVPAGTYYFDTRRKPISTVQYGNMQLVINCSAVTSSASVFLVGYEQFAMQNMITQAGSLYNT